MANLVAQHPVAYYTTANAAHYPGAVALLNSLRLLGEDAPLFVVDCGLLPAQREALSLHATVVSSSGTLAPGLQKTTGPLTHPAEVMVIIDADVIVNRLFTPLFDDARLGKVVGFQDCEPRFVAEWSSLGLGTAVPGTYINGGHFILSVDTAAELFPVFTRLMADLDVKGTCYAPGLISNRHTHPFFFADQDILNAILCTHYAGQVVQLERDAWSYPPFAGLSLSPAGDHFCKRDDGGVPFLLHHFANKPWLTPLRPSVYAELFTRIVTAPEAPIRLGARELPLRMTDSRFAPVARWEASMRHTARTHLRGKLGLRPALARARAERAAR